MYKSLFIAVLYWMLALCTASTASAQAPGIHFVRDFTTRKRDLDQFADLQSDRYKVLGRNTGSGAYMFQFPPEAMLEPNLGQRQNPSTRVRHILRSDNAIFYDATYSFDEFSRRHASIPNATSRKKFVILFGCSFTYGYGLNDNETLNYYLGQVNKRYFPYNYAIGSSGPHMMLALLQERNFRKQVPQESGVFIYVIIDDHLPRATGKLPSLQWLKNSPYYQMNKDESLTRKGSLLSGRPIYSRALLFLHAVQEMLGYGNRIFPEHTAEDTRYVCSLIKESQREFLSQYSQGKFFVYRHPQSRPREDLLACLKEKGVAVILGTSQEEAKGLTIPGDGHPNAKVNQLIANELSDVLEGL